MSKRVLGRVGLIAGLAGLAAAGTAYYLKQRKLDDAENGDDIDASDTDLDASSDVTLPEVDENGEVSVPESVKEEIIKNAREMIHRNKDNGEILEALESKYGKDYTYDTLKELIQEAEQ